MPESKKRKVLIIDNSTGVTGAFKSIFALTSKLSNQFHFHYCIHPDSSLAGFLAARHEKVLPITFQEIRRNAMALLYFPRLVLNAWRILSFLKRHGIEVVHVNDLYNMLGVVVKILKPGIKVVYHIRLMQNSYAGPLYKGWMKLVLTFADEIICVSNAVRKTLPPDHRIKTIYDVSEHGPASRARMASEPITLLYLANYINGKGHDHAIEAFALAKKTCANLKMIMAGGDLGLDKNRRYKRHLQLLASAHEVANDVTFLDFISDTGSLFHKADIALNFSDSESFSLTCLEALRSGVPLIATDSGGPAELFEDGISGLLVPVKDVAAMAGKIVLLSSDPLLRVRLAENGRKYVAEKFQLTESANELSKIYLA